MAIDMPVLKVNVGIGRPDGGELSSVTLGVDSSAAHSVLPASLLAGLGIVPRRQVELTRLDGSAGWYDYGLARFRIGGEEWPCPVVFGPEDDGRLGASALDIFNLAVDHTGDYLKPSKWRSLGQLASGPNPDALQGAAAILQMFKEIHESMPEGALDDLPTDLSVNFKHHLYGWPKEVE